MPKCNEKEFYFKTSAEAEEICKRQRSTVGSEFLCLLRDRAKCLEHHRDLKKWKEQRTSQGKATKVNID